MRPEEVGENQLVDGSARAAYQHWLVTESDIQDHLEFLYLKSQGNVLELGTRGGVSTSALLCGVESNGGHLFSVDINQKCGEAFKGHSQWTFVHGNSLDDRGSAVYQLLAFAFDLLFIDTEHTYGQLRAELARWAPLVKKGGVIAIHDMIAFPGYANAAIEYAEQRKLDFKIRTNSNGLGVIQL